MVGTLSMENGTSLVLQEKSLKINGKKLLGLGITSTKMESCLVIQPLTATC